MTREHIIQLAKECGATVIKFKESNKVASVDFLAKEIERFYHAAQQEALQHVKVQIPTDAMEQAFNVYHRRGYEKGLAEAYEKAAQVCMDQCRVIEEPHEFERCAEAIRKLKEKS